MTDAARKSRSVEARSRKAAQEAIRKLLGGRGARLTRQNAGQTNLVYHARHSRGEFVVRLAQAPERINAFIKEQWCVERARRAGVPTAEILEVGTLPNGTPFMIAQCIDGDVGASRADDLPITEQMGRLLARIHSIRTRGFGETFDWSRNRLSRARTWKEYVESELKANERVETLSKHRMLDRKQLSRLRQGVETIACWHGRAVLNHGDMRRKNVIVDERGTIKAVLDWERCLSSAGPAWDLSIALHDLTIDAKEAMLRGYGASDSAIRTLVPALRVFNCLNYAPEIREAAARRDARRLKALRLRLAGTYDLFGV